jgi:hypothetical protein
VQTKIYRREDLPLVELISKTSLKHLACQELTLDNKIDNCLILLKCKTKDLQVVKMLISNKDPSSNSRDHLKQILIILPSQIIYIEI